MRQNQAIAKLLNTFRITRHQSQGLPSGFSLSVNTKHTIFSTIRRWSLIELKNLRQNRWYNYCNYLSFSFICYSWIESEKCFGVRPQYNCMCSTYKRQNSSVAGLSAATVCQSEHGKSALNTRFFFFFSFAYFRISLSYYTTTVYI